MRKVLSFVLVLALVLGSFSMAFAATPAGGFSDTDAEAVSVLADLDVIDGYPDGSFKPGNVVTRAEMAKLIIVALGLEDFATATTSKYTDMAGAGWAQGYVAYATSLGIIEGYPDGTFGPSNPVTYNEACAMIVRALGYTADFLPGGWPAEWVVKAQTLGILDGVSAAGAAGATRGNIAEMLYNALELEIGYVNKDGDWVANTPQDTMLIRLGATLIAADDAAALTGAGFEADGIIYGWEDSTINLRAFVGAYADRYINDDDEIIKVVPVSTFLTGEYNDADEVFEADNGTDYNVPSELQHDWVTEFYNGLYTWETQDIGCFTDYYDFDTMTIAVKISGKTIKDLYSVSAWETDIAFQFDDDYADEITDDQTLDGEDFILDDNDEIDLHEFELAGAASLDAIEEDNVVYVYVDDEGDIRKIEVGTEVVEGKVSKVSGDDYTIGGKVYNLSDITAPEIAIGDSGTAYLDFDGDIAYWDIDDAAEGNYAVLVDTDVSTAWGDEIIKVKLFTEAGEEVVAELDMDNETTLAGLTVGNIVEYSLNSKGEVDDIEDAGAVAIEGKATADGSLIGTIPVKSSAVVFLDEGSDDYSLGDVADFDTAEYVEDYNAWAVMDGGKIDALIIDDGIVGGGSESYGVINATSSALNDDDDIVIALEGFIDGKTLDALTDKENLNAYDEFVGGWLVMITVDSNGVVTEMVDAELEVEATQGFSDNVTVNAIDGSIITLFDGVDKSFKVATGAVIYEWNYDDEEWEVKTSVSALKGNEIYMYQTTDDVVGFDIILAW